MAGQTILIVDDDLPLCSAMAAHLNRGGYIALTANGAEQAMRVLAGRSDIDLILSDMNMPGTDGIGLLDLVVTHFPQIPLVLVTAVANIHATLNAFRRGATNFLMKPFQAPELLDLVELALEQARRKRDGAASLDEAAGSGEQKVLARTERMNKVLEALELSYDVTLQVMGDALDLRDTETEGHSRRVTAYTSVLADAIELDADELRVVTRGAFLHDIGKIATPDSILLKPGPLDACEWKIMQQHCEQGYQIVRKIPFLRDAGEIVYAHQERFDGTGYPRGLKGEQIPLGARIFAVADTLDAITSDRPYRERRTFREASQEIVHSVGSQFDPAVVSAFLRIDPARWQSLRDEVDGVSGVPAALTRPPLALCPPGVF